MSGADDTPAGEPLSEAERRDWLQLIRSDNVGPATFQDLLTHYGSAGDALEALPELARRTGQRLRIHDRRDAERELAAIADLGGGIVALPGPGYPAWLRQTDGAPPVLAWLGDPASLSRPMIAIVGARDASVAGRRMAEALAVGLAGRGFVVASGLARGIDAAAHAAALEGGTVAVLAGGLDRIYPPENLGLAERIARSGSALVSEMPLGWVARGRDFPRRNRIISGLALATVVVEAARRSGTMITARNAAEQGRAVLAVPGSPLDPRAYGTNLLIKEGAQIATEVDDIVALVEPMIGNLAVPAPVVPQAAGASVKRDIDPGTRERDLVVEALGPAPVEIDSIIRLTGLDAPTVHVVLLELDLAGRLERHPGGRVSSV